MPRPSASLSVAHPACLFAQWWSETYHRCSNRLPKDPHGLREGSYDLEAVRHLHHQLTVVSPGAQWVTVSEARWPSHLGRTTLSGPPLHSERSLEPPFSPWRHWVKLGCLWLSGLGGSWHSLVGARDVSSARSTQDAPMSSVPGQGGIGYSAGRLPPPFRMET